MVSQWLDKITVETSAENYYTINPKINPDNTQSKWDNSIKYLAGKRGTCARAITWPLFRNCYIQK